MPDAPFLSDDEIVAGLRALNGWQRRGDRLLKTMRFDDFRGAVDFVARITPVADEQNHHPDVAIHWNELTLTLWTHAAGGITARDLRLARSIDALETEHAQA